MRFGEGFVEEIKDNGLAKVRVSRDSLYVACSVCAAADHVKLLAYNSIANILSVIVDEDEEKEEN